MTVCLPATSRDHPSADGKGKKRASLSGGSRTPSPACDDRWSRPCVRCAGPRAYSRTSLSCSVHRSPLSYRVRCARNSAPPSLMGSALVSRRSLPGRMLINLLPDFFAVLDSTDRVAAYQRYFEAHRRILEPYWHNYVVDPDGPHFGDVVRATALADRSDLREMLERTDVVALARSTEQRCAQLLEQDVDVDVVLMIGVGA